MQIFPYIDLVMVIRFKEGIVCWFSTAHGSDTLQNRTGLDSQAHVLYSPHIMLFLLNTVLFFLIIFIIFKLLINNFLCTLYILSNSLIWSWFLHMKSIWGPGSSGPDV